MFLQVSQQLRSSHYVPLVASGIGKRLSIIFDGFSVSFLQTITIMASRFEGDKVLFKLSQKDFSIQGNVVKMVTVSDEYPSGIDYSGKLGQIGVLLNFNSSITSGGNVIVQIE